MEAASTGMSDLVPNGNVVNRSCPGTGSVNGAVLATCSVCLDRTGGCVHGACGGDGLCVCEDGWSGSTCEDYCPGFPACGGPLRGHCSVVSIAKNQTARSLGLLALLKHVASTRFGRRCVCQSGFSGDGCDNYSCPPCLNGGSCFFSEDCADGHKCTSHKKYGLRPVQDGDNRSVCQCLPAYGLILIGFDLPAAWDCKAS